MRLFYITCCLSVAALADAAIPQPVKSIAFEPNVGQTSPSIEYVAHIGPALITFENAAATIHLQTTDGTPTSMRIRPVDGATTHAESTGDLPSKSYYYRGSNQFAVPHHAGVRYRNVYPHTDLIYYGRNGNIEYDFILQPGASSSHILLAVDGANETTLSSDGALEIMTSAGLVRQHQPIAYQETEHGRSYVSAAYCLEDDVISISVGAYDPSRALVIDPVLTFATFHGGTGNEKVSAVGVDPYGFVYIAGSTVSTNFPLKAARQNVRNGSSDAYISKFTPDGAELVYSSYLGGSSTDEIVALETTTHGDVVVAGTTGSADYPTSPGSFRPQRLASGTNTFLTRLSADGATLVYSTYIGVGSVKDLALHQESAYIAGACGICSSFPIMPSASIKSTTTTPDAFVTRVSKDGTSLIFSTLLGGTTGENADPGATYEDSIFGIAVDRGGSVYVAGETKSPNFPVTSGVVQAAPGGNNGPGGAQWDGFVTKLRSDGRAIEYSTFLGGTGSETVRAIAVDEDGNAFITGSTTSANFTTTSGALFRTPDVLPAFVAKLNPQASRLLFSTYFSSAAGIAQYDGLTYLAGHAAAGFPVTGDAHQTAFGGGLSDLYLAVLNRTGTALKYASYYGGSEIDYAGALHLSSSGVATIAGVTTSADLPTRQPRQPAYAGGDDAFIVQFSFDTDGDGLLDDWEEHGIDVNGDGTVDLDLPALGATKNKKDLFVEIDYMVAGDHTHHPLRLPDGNLSQVSNAVARVTAAFAAAPVSNPDGTNGIRLHVLVDEALAEQRTLTMNPPTGISEFHVIKDGSPVSPCGSGHFGTPAQRKSSNCRHIIAAAKRVYRYAVFAHDLTNYPGTAGVADTPGDDLVVSLRVLESGSDFEDRARTAARRYGTTFDEEWSNTAAGAFMHELGHTLGLQHGGGIGIDAANAQIGFKPNYLSVMNYAYAYNMAGLDATSPATVIRTNRPIDYSRSQLPDLNESSLDEAVGVAGEAGRRVVFGESGIEWIAPAAGPIDWNRQNGIQPSVSVDVNFLGSFASTVPSPGERLSGHDDWAVLLYSFRDTRAYSLLGAFDADLDVREPAADDDTGPDAPTVALTSPEQGDTFSAPAAIVLTAVPASNDGIVTSVRFYANDTLLGAVSSSPYVIEWDDIPMGSYSLRAEAIDSYGGVGVSSAVVVRVGSCTSPTISQQPAAQLLPVGASHTLTMQAGGSEPRTIQWFRGPAGVISDPVLYGTATSLVVAPSSTTSYWARVTNSCGIADTSAATVTVTLPNDAFVAEPVSELLVTEDGNGVYWNPPPVRQIAPADPGVWSAQGMTSVDSGLLRDGDTIGAAATFGLHGSLFFDYGTAVTFREIELHWTSTDHPSVEVLSWTNPGEVSSLGRVQTINPLLDVILLPESAGARYWELRGDAPSAVALAEVRFVTYATTPYAHVATYRLVGLSPSGDQQVVDILTLPTSTSPIPLNNWRYLWERWDPITQLGSGGSHTLLSVSTVSTSGSVSDNRARYEKRLEYAAEGPPRPRRRRAIH